MCLCQHIGEINKNVLDVLGPLEELHLIVLHLNLSAEESPLEGKKTSLHMKDSLEIVQTTYFRFSFRFDLFPAQ